MSTEQLATSKNRYYSVIDGTFRVQVPASDPNAIERHWETKDGKSGVKHEKHVKALFGIIENIAIVDTDFGKNLNIYLDDDENGHTPVISLNVDSRWGGDLLKRLPNLEKGKEYRFMPFAFTPEDSDKEKKGISVTSRDDEGKFTVKVDNFFFDGEKSINGFPEPDEEDKQDWAFFYKKVTKFLVKYAEENVLPKFAVEPAQAPDYPEEDIKPEDVPF